MIGIYFIWSCTVILQPDVAGPVAMRLNLPAGTEFTLATQSWVTQTITSGGRSTDYKARLDNVRRAKVIDLDRAGNLRIELTYLDYQLYIIGPNGEVPAKDAFKHYLGAKVRVVVAPTGKLIGIEGFDEYLKQLQGKSTGLAALFGAFMRPENLKLELEQLFDFLPPQAIRPGESWEADSVIAAIDTADLKVKNRYRFQGHVAREGVNLAQIDLSVTIRQTNTTPLAANPNMKQAKSIKYEIEEMGGTIWFDARQGRPVAAELQGVIKMVHLGSSADRNYLASVRVKQKVSYDFSPLRPANEPKP